MRVNPRRSHCSCRFHEIQSFPIFPFKCFCLSLMVRPDEPLTWRRPEAQFSIQGRGSRCCRQRGVLNLLWKPILKCPVASGHQWLVDAKAVGARWFRHSLPPQTAGPGHRDVLVGQGLLCSWQCLLEALIWCQVKGSNGARRVMAPT